MRPVFLTSANMRLTPKQAAEYLNCCVAIIYGLCESNRLVHYRLGNGRGKILIDTADLDAFLEKCRVGPLLKPSKPAVVKLKHLDL